MPASEGESPRETSPPAEEAVLNIPLSQARTELQERIDAGRELIRTRLRSAVTILAIQERATLSRDIGDWQNHNQLWLDVNLGGEVAQEYRAVCFYIPNLIRTSPMLDALTLRRLRQAIAEQITTLQSIHRRLPHWTPDTADHVTDTSGQPRTTIGTGHPLQQIVGEQHERDSHDSPATITVSAYPVGAATVYAANRKTVMVIYGHDQEANNALFDWLRAIGLQPREWTQLIHATAVASPYPGQILDSAFGQAQAVVALFTPDEYVTSRTPAPTGADARRLQSRPNVLIETGMALAIHPLRTILAVLGNLELPSDLAGLHHIRLSRTDPAPLIDLANRLHAVGCDTDTTGTHWLSPARFPDRTIAASAPTVPQPARVVNKHTKVPDYPKTRMGWLRR